MSDVQNTPSPEKTEPKMFEGIRGARSRDPEAQSTSPSDQGQEAETESAPEASESAKGEEPKDAGGGTLRMKQEIAKLQRQLTNLNPWAQLGMAVGREDDKAIERWQRGGRIFGGNRAAEEHLREAAEDQQDGPHGASLQDINQLLDQRDAAREQLSRLKELARDNLEHFDKISKNQLYSQFLNNNLHAVWNGHMELDESTYGWADEQLAKNFTAMKAAYRQVLADNPKVVEAAKRAGQKEAKERAEAAMAGEGSSGSRSSGHEEAPPKTEAEEMIDRMINPRGRGGRSFAEIGRPKK